MLPLIKFRLWISGRKSWKSDATSFPLNVIRWSMILNCPFGGYVHFFPWLVCVCVCGVQIPTSPRRLAYLTQRQAEQVRAQEYFGLYLVGQKFLHFFRTILISFWVGIFSGYMPRNGIARSCGNSIFSFFKDLPYCFPQWLFWFTFPSGV